MSQAIVFTGGGTAGHVTPNLPLIDSFQQEGWNVSYIGSHSGVEQAIITARNIPYYPISSGKLRRYFSWSNLSDPLKIFWGIIQSWRILGRLKPQVLFSKGGFVAVPVVIAAWLRGIPVIAHESDMSPGLANRLCYPFVKKVCLNFAPTVKHFNSAKKIQVTGSPIRKELFCGSKEKGLTLCGFKPNKPCLLVMGGSLGSEHINQVVREAASQLSDQFQIIHLCGKGKTDDRYSNLQNYCQFEYVNEEMADLLAASEVVVSRSGANTVSELLSLHKPHVLIPLSKKASRGDQIQNAQYFQEQGVSYVIPDNSLTVQKLISTLQDVMKHKTDIIQKIQALKMESATENVVNIIKEQLCRTKG